MQKDKLVLIIIPTALVLGTTMFLLVASMAAINVSEFEFVFDKEKQSDLLLPFLAIFGSSFIASIIIPKIILKKEASNIQVQLKALLIKYAMLEGSSFFGIIVFMTAYPNGGAVSFGEPWLGLIAYAVLLLTYILDLPRLIRQAKGEAEVKQDIDRDAY